MFTRIFDRKTQTEWISFRGGAQIPSRTPTSVSAAVLWLAANVCGVRTMTPVGFEPTQLALVELESTPLDHSGKVSMSSASLVRNLRSHFHLCKQRRLPCGAKFALCSKQQQHWCVNNCNICFDASCASGAWAWVFAALLAIGISLDGKPPSEESRGVNFHAECGAAFGAPEVLGPGYIDYCATILRPALRLRLRPSLAKKYCLSSP